MPAVRVNGIDLHYEEVGSGTPVVFSHEFAGSWESWMPQMQFFARRYRCIAYNHRGYPPSAVPSDPAAYSEDQLVDDLRGLLDALSIERAFIVGLSMGGAVSLKFAIAHPERCLGNVVSAAGAGTTDRDAFEQEMEHTARVFERDGVEAVGQFYTSGPTRIQLMRKDPRGWQEFQRLFLLHSAQGSANTIRGVQLRRRTIFQTGDAVAGVRVPMLVVIGDEDEAALDAALFMKRRIRSAGLCVFPMSGHAVNLEEPALFNSACLDFFTAVEQGRWPERVLGATAPTRR
ncbi:MAG: alpha/beta fold hydrolase [Dehalococcoidia bacterium]